MGIRTLVPFGSPARLKRASLARVVIAGVVGFFVALLVGVSPAMAQDTDNSLQSIEPADGSSLGASPEQIILSFNQELDDDDFVTVQVTCGGIIQDTGQPEIDRDRLLVTVSLAPVPRGNCIIGWRLANGLGETILQESTTFGVTVDPVGVTTDDSTTDTTDPNIRVTIPAAPTAQDTVDEGSSGGAIWLGRLLSTIGIMLVFGGLTLISVGWPEGPEYVVTVRFLRTAWVFGLLGTLIYVVAFAADFGGTSFGSAISPGAWLDLNDAGWAGRGALLRLVFVAASGAVALRPERIIDPTSAMWAWALPGFAVITVALSRTGGPAAPIGFVVGAGHALAAAVWVGGAALVARVVLAGPGDDDLVQATRTFSRISIPAILLTAVTGVIQVIRLVGDGLFTSSHGQVVLLKVIAVAAMLAVALAVRQQVSMRLDRAQELTAPTADRFRRAFGAEATLGIVVLAFSGWLLALTPAQVDPLAGKSYKIPIEFIDPAAGLTVKVSIGEGVVGQNSLRVDVAEPAEGLNLRLRFIPPNGASGDARFIIEQPVPLDRAGIAVWDQSVGVPFLTSGTWTLELIASTADGVPQVAGRTFLITNADGSTDSIPQVAETTPVSVNLIDVTTTEAPLATSPATTLDPAATTTVP